MGKLQFLQRSCNGLHKSAKGATPAVSHAHPANQRIFRADELEKNYYLPAPLAGLISND